MPRLLSPLGLAAIAACLATLAAPPLPAVAQEAGAQADSAQEDDAGAARRRSAFLASSRQILKSDPEATNQKLQQELARALKLALPKIVGGAESPEGYFRETVGIRASKSHDGAWLCTGVLLAQNAVLTAAHCVCDLGLQDVHSGDVKPAEITVGEFIGRHTGEESSTEGIAITKAVLYDPHFCERKANFGGAITGVDLALLKIDASPTSLPLEEPGPGALHPLAPGHATWARIMPTFSYLMSNVRSMMIVGFGQDDTGTVGRKRLANVAIASRICGTPLARALFQCQAGTEMILASTGGQDTCSGDSGGPAFAVLGSEYYLAGITSRAADPSGKCGPGGIYTFITPEFVHWIKSQGVAVHASE